MRFIWSNLRICYFCFLYCWQKFEKSTFFEIVVFSITYWVFFAFYRTKVKKCKGSIQYSKLFCCKVWYQREKLESLQVICQGVCQNHCELSIPLFNLPRYGALLPPQPSAQGWILLLRVFHTDLCLYSTFKNW